MGDAELVADCGRCVDLCCVVLPFTRSTGQAGFAFAKAAGEPCRHLTSAHACGVHATLAGRGMGGCVSYDCLGAGQYVVARRPGAGAAALREEFLLVERLHELLVLLNQAVAWAPGDRALAPLRRRVAAARDREPEDGDPDVDALAGEVGAALDRVSRAVRGTDGASYRRADLAGRDLRGVDLARADLRGAVLIGVDLRGSVLDRTDLLGADLRDADLRGADLATALFITRPQLARAVS